MGSPFHAIGPFIPTNSSYNQYPTLIIMLTTSKMKVSLQQHASAESETLSRHTPWCPSILFVLLRMSARMHCERKNIHEEQIFIDIYVPENDGQESGFFWRSFLESVPKTKVTCRKPKTTVLHEDTVARPKEGPVRLCRAGCN